MKLERTAPVVPDHDRQVAASAAVSVVFQPSGRRFSVARGETLFEIAADAGVAVDAVCGGNGSCGKCKVRIADQAPVPAPADYMHLTGGEMADGYRLSCQVHADRDLTVHVPANGDRARVRILHHGVTREVELHPNIKKVFLPYSNPRHNEHVADWDRIRATLPRKLRPTGIPLDLLRALPALCRDEAGMTLVLAGRNVIGIEPGNTSARNYGVAFDIGSTTIVGFLIDLSTGQEVATASAANKQAAYGDDIVGRLSRAQRNAEGLARLHDMLIEQLNAILGELAAKADGGRGSINEVTIVGNMAMHHFLLKLDTTYLGLAPYAPVLRNSMDVEASELGLDLRARTPVFVLPNIAGFVGSDTVGVMLATEIAGSREYRMAIDVGTNGEIVLANRRRTIACSAPAGPALEGARIKMGMRAAPGAIDHVRIDDDVHFTVIGDIPPVGICGSALIDIAAQLCQVGLLSASGAFLRHAELADTVPATLRKRLVEAKNRRDSYFLLALAADTGAERDIIFTQQDVRECQLAKGAIRAGTMLLLDEMGIGVDDLETVMLAGAFGNFLDSGNARRAGLTPPVPLERIQSVGNAAGVGAKLALVSVVERRNAIRLAGRAEHIQLSGSEKFQKAFAQAMKFPQL
ncbi:MAG: ASKHA domain-containing protein [Sphingomonadales bacterium]